MDAPGRKTEDGVFRARDEGGRAGERDDVGVRRINRRRRRGRPRIMWMGEIWWKRDGPGGAERSGEEPERARRMLTMTFAMINRIDGTRWATF